MGNLNDLFHIEEFNEFSLQCLDKSDVLNLFEVDEKELDKIVERTIKKCHIFGTTHLFRSNILSNENGVRAIGAIGLYLIVKYNCELKKYQIFQPLINELQEIYVEESLRLLNKFLKTKTKRKKSDLIVSEDDMASFAEKRVDAINKTPDLDTIENKDHFFYSKQIVITGNFENFPDRNLMAGIIKDFGGFVKSAISKGTNLVIVGTSPGPSKLKTIAENDIETINESQFLDFIK